MIKFFKNGTGMGMRFFKLTLFPRMASPGGRKWDPVGTRILGLCTSLVRPRFQDLSWSFKYFLFLFSDWFFVVSDRILSCAAPKSPRKAAPSFMVIKRTDWKMRCTSAPFYIVHNGIFENITESGANENFIKSYSQERPTIIFRREAPFYITHTCADF